MILKNLFFCKSEYPQKYPDIKNAKAEALACLIEY